MAINCPANLLIDSVDRLFVFDIAGISESKLITFLPAKGPKQPIKLSVDLSSKMADGIFVQLDDIWIPKDQTITAEVQVFDSKANRTKRLPLLPTQPAEVKLRPDN